MSVEETGGGKPVVEPVSDYFDTESRAQCLNLVAHLVRNTEELPFVSAPAGAGKSRFGARLASELGDDFRVVLIAVSAALDLAAEICRRLKLPPPEGDWIAHLLDVDDKPLLVLLDDAEALNPSSQQALLDMRAEGLRLILVGATPLPPALAEGVREIGLPPLSEQESRAYLGFLARRAGVTVAPPVAVRLHKASGGWPGRLAVQLANGRSPAKRGNALPGGLGWWLLALVVLSLAGAALWFQEEINGLFEGGHTGEPVTTQEPPSEPLARQPLPLPPAVEPEPAPESEPAPEPAPMPEPPQAPVVELPVVTERPVAAGTDEVHPAEQPAPPVAVETEPEAVPEPVPPPAAVPEAVKPAKPESASAQASAEPSPAVAGEQDEPTQAQAQDAGVAWIRAQAADAYTLQLLGAREPAAIKRFIARHQLTGRYAIFQRQLAGKPWYSLVMGSYPDRAGAAAALAAMPKALRRDDAWPRSFGSIQQLLDRP